MIGAGGTPPPLASLAPLLIALPVLLMRGAACAPASGPPVGTSDPKPRAHGSVATPAPSTPNPIPSDFRTRYTKVTARFASSGHFVGRYDAIVWTTEDAKDPWTQQGSFPNGARIVMEHLRRGSDEAGPILAMERRDGAWRFVMVASDQRVIVDGDAAACAQCHAEAPRDSVFFVR